MFVYVHSVASRGACGKQWLDAGQDADPDDCHVSRQGFATGQPHAGQVAIVTNKALDASSQSHVDAMIAMLLFVEARERLGCHAGKDPVHRLEDGNSLANLGQNGCSLKPDIAASNDDHTLDVAKLRHDTVDIAPTAHGMDAAKFLTVTSHFPGPPSCGPDQMAIAKGRAIRTKDALFLGFQADGFVTEQEVDIPRSPEFGRTDENALEWPGAGKIILGQRRALIGQIVIVADKTDRSRKPMLSKRDRRLDATVSTANNKTIVVHHRAPPIRRNRFEIGS